MITRMKLKSKGFTLVEVIITLVVAAIVGTMMFTTLGKSLSGSSDPIFRMQKSLSLQKVMENLVTAYEKYYGGDLPGLKDSIGTEGTTVTGSNDVINGYCPKSDKCEYTVVKNRYIKFESNAEVELTDPPLATDPKDLLKVTIKNSNNETLTFIFAG